MISATVPLAVTMEEQIKAIRSWAHERALNASTPGLGPQRFAARTWKSGGIDSRSTPVAAMEKLAASSPSDRATRRIRLESSSAPSTRTGWHDAYRRSESVSRISCSSAGV